MKNNLKKFLSIIGTFSLVTGVISCSVQTNTTELSIISNTDNELLAKKSQQIRTFNSQFDQSGLSKRTLNLKLKTHLTDDQINILATKYQMKVKRYIKSINLLTLEFTDLTQNSLNNKINTDNNVLSVLPSIKVQIDPLQVNENPNAVIEDINPNRAFNDPLFSDQYGLKLMQLEEAWKINSGNKAIKIAMVDTGVDLNHPDLKNKLVAGKNIADPTQPPMDDSGHGTHTAGIAAAELNNGEGGAGVCANCSIMPVKVLVNGSGTDDTIAAGIVWAADNGANVISMSLGIYRSSRPIEDALKYALDKNVTIVASAGNKNAAFDVHLPSTYPGVIEVASTDENDQKSVFSNFGKTVSVSAPGTDILSTLPTYKVGVKPLSYGKLSGTSMAAPHVAGLAGLILSQKPGLKPAEVRKIIESTAKDLGDIGLDQYFGNGRVDALAALQSLK